MEVCGVQMCGVLRKVLFLDPQLLSQEVGIHHYVHLCSMHTHHSYVYTVLHTVNATIKFSRTGSVAESEFGYNPTGVRLQGDVDRNMLLFRYGC